MPTNPLPWFHDAQIRECILSTSYHCIVCSCSLSLIDGLVCQSCRLESASQGKTTLLVLYCLYCGKSQDQRGTECRSCEEERKVHGPVWARVTRQRDEKIEQQVLW